MNLCNKLMIQIKKSIWIKNELINEKTKYNKLYEQNKLNNKKMKSLKLLNILIFILLQIQLYNKILGKML